MIPKTKLEKQISGLKVSKPNLNFIKKDLKNLFPSYSYPHYKDNICGDCQGKFKITEEEKKKEHVVCPHCKRQLMFLDYRQPIYKAERVAVIYDTVEDIQIFKYVTVVKKSYKHNKPEFFYKHEFNLYVNMKGLSRVVRYDFKKPFLTNPPHNSNYYYQDSHKSYNTSMVHHLLRRNGYDDSSVINTFRRHILFLMTDSFYESMIKFHEFNIARYYQNCNKREQIDFVEKFKKIIYQGLRLNFDFTYFNIFKDYISAAEFLNYNLKDPKILFPKNLREAHDIAIDLRHEIQGQITNKQKRREKAMEIYRYPEKKNKYFDVCITSGNITIVPLKHVGEFVREGIELDHCVYKSEYYKKDDSLILSAMVDGIKTETVEVIISKKTINQCYGHDNTLTKHHNKIMKLVNSNMNLILNENEQRNRSNRKLQESNI